MPQPAEVHAQQHSNSPNRSSRSAAPPLAAAAGAVAVPGADPAADGRPTEGAPEAAGEVAPSSVLSVPASQAGRSLASSASSPCKLVMVRRRSTLAELLAPGNQFLWPQRKKIAPAVVLSRRSHLTRRPVCRTSFSARRRSSSEVLFSHLGSGWTAARATSWRAASPRYSTAR